MTEAADQIDQDQSPQIHRGNNLYGLQELVADPRSKNNYEKYQCFLPIDGLVLKLLFSRIATVEVTWEQYSLGWVNVCLAERTDLRSRSFT